MKPFFLSSILLVIIVVAVAAATTVEDTCKSVAAARPNIRYEFCVKSLNSDPQSGSADPNGLAVIASGLASLKATDIESEVESLKEAEPNPSRKDCLSVCSEVYSGAVDRLGDAISNLRSGNYHEAVTFLSAALDASDNCEDGFGDVGEQSPMAAEDEEYGRLADIALTIAAALG